MANSANLDHTASKWSTLTIHVCLIFLINKVIGSNFLVTASVLSLIFVLIDLKFNKPCRDQSMLT